MTSFEHLAAYGQAETDQAFNSDYWDWVQARSADEKACRLTATVAANAYTRTAAELQAGYPLPEYRCLELGLDPKTGQPLHTSPE